MVRSVPLNVPDIPDVRPPACAPEHELLFQRHRAGLV